VVFGLKKYRQHLLGRPIIVRTDHAALKYLLTTLEPVGQQGRWLDLLSEYDITIQHRPGRVHGNSDALSRRPCERSSETNCQQCRQATPTLAVAPVSCDALPADSTSVLPAPLRFLPLHSQADESTDPSIGSAPTDIVSDHLEVPALPVPPCEATPASSAHTVNTWSQILGVTAEPTSITLDDIREAQSLDDNLQPVIQSLSEEEKPPQGNQPNCPEETPVLFGRWASVVPVDGTTYCQFDDATGPLRALVLPSASQVRERYAQGIYETAG